MFTETHGQRSFLPFRIRNNYKVSGHHTGFLRLPETCRTIKFSARLFASANPGFKYNLWNAKSSVDRGPNNLLWKSWNIALRNALRISSANYFSFDYSQLFWNRECNHSNCEWESLKEKSRFVFLQTTSGCRTFCRLSSGNHRHCLCSDGLFGTPIMSG